MVLENMLLMMLHMREIGLRVRKKGKVRLYLKVEVFFKVTLKMIWNMDMVRCITIHLEIILKENGNKMLNREWELWIGLIFVRNMLEIGRIINKKVGAFIFGWNLKVKENSWEIVIKVFGNVVFDKVLAYFIMLMDQNMKVIGRIIWRKAILSTLTKMEKYH